MNIYIRIIIKSKINTVSSQCIRWIPKNSVLYIASHENNYIDLKIQKTKIQKTKEGKMSNNLKPFFRLRIIWTFLNCTLDCALLNLHPPVFQGTATDTCTCNILVSVRKTVFNYFTNSMPSLRYSEMILLIS